MPSFTYPPAQHKKVCWSLLNRDYAIFLLIYINLKVTENASQYAIQPDNKNLWNQRFICCFVWVLLREQIHKPTHITTAVYKQHTVIVHAFH